MKPCEPCGTENPDDARFCMKCGNDLDADQVSEAPPQIIHDGAFTPAGAAEDGRPARTRKPRDKGPMPDIPSFGQSKAPEIEATEGISPKYREEQPPEIHLTDVTSDFAEQQKFCERCGVGNPHEQKFCRNCGSALGSEELGAADEAYEKAAKVPLSKEAVETTSLADATPATHYYAEEGRGGRTPVARGRRLEFSFERIADWEVREWLALTVATVIFAALIWFFAFGGMRMLFSSRPKNIRKAGATMTRPGSFQYSISIAMENSQTGQYPGNGTLTFEAPDKTSYGVNLNIPGRPPLAVQHVQVGNKPYMTVGGAWQASDPKATLFYVDKLWEGPSNVEDLGNQNLGGLDCLHYRYRIPSETITALLGAFKPEGVSDAVMEIWIDRASFSVPRLIAQVYNLQIEGVRTRATLNFDLAAIGQVYNIVPPI